MNINELELTIKNASQAYYSGQEIMSDDEFDDLMNQLRLLDPENELLTIIAHGYDIDLDNSGEKLPHQYGIVGSLDKVGNSNYKSYPVFQNPDLIITSKLDGSSCVVYYENGKLVRALTRGTGILGVDVTDKIIHLAPTTLTTKDTIAIRGEVLIRIDTFKKYYPEEAPNGVGRARNISNGIFKSKSPLPEMIKRLEFVAYKAYNDEVQFTKKGMLAYLNENKFKVVESLESTNQLEKDELENLKGTIDKNYPADGLVITVNNNVNLEVAYKFQPESKETTVNKVVWSMSRLGNYIPVILYNPVILAGASLGGAHGFNAKYVNDNKIGEGSRIVIQRSGEVIPYIKEILSEGSLELPTTCPYCHSELQWRGVNLACVNSSCSRQSKYQLYNYYAYLYQIDQLSVSYLSDFIDNVGWTKITDMYNTTKEQWDEAIHKSFQPKSHADILLVQFYNNVFNTKIEPKRFIAAFGLPSVGLGTSTRISEEVGLAKFFASSYNETYMRSLSRVTYPAIQSIKENFDYLKEVYEKVVLIGFKESTNVIKYKVAITGKLSKPRNKLVEEFLDYGIEVTGVGKGVKYLITDDPNSGSSKNIAAQKFGIQTISEEEFRKLL